MGKNDEPCAGKYGKDAPTLTAQIRAAHVEENQHLANSVLISSAFHIVWPERDAEGPLAAHNSRVPLCFVSNQVIFED
jgi:hypothetical protein